MAAPETNLERLAREKREAAMVLAEENKMFSYDSIAEMSDWNQQMLKVAHRSVAKNTTMPEFAYFINYAKSLDLSPLHKEVWCYKDHKDNVIVFTGRDGFLKLCKRDPFYMGFRSSEVRENDIFVIDIPNAFVEHRFDNKERGKIIGAWCKVFAKEGKEAILEFTPFSEYNKGEFVWKAVPSEMIKKIAESHAFKKFAGIPGLQNIDEFKLDESGVASHINEKSSEEIKTEKQVEKEDKRLELLIKNASSIDQLRSYLPHAQTPDLVELYDQRKKELEK